MNVKKSNKLVLYSFLLVSVVLLITYSMIPISFDTNDDVSLMYTLAGYKSGEGIASCIFSNVIYGYWITLLYRFMPNIPWYTVNQMVLIGLSLIVIAGIFIGNKARKRKLSGILCFIILYFCVYLYPTSILQFSTTPAIIGSAACLLILSYDTKDEKRVILLKQALSIFLLVWSYLYRSFSGYVCIVYFIVCVLVNYFKNKDNKVIITCLMALLLIGTGYTVNITAQKGEQWEQYLAFHKERTMFTDYGHPSFDEAETLYTEVGWDRELFKLADQWFFLDDRINTSNLKYINTFKVEKEMNLSQIKQTLKSFIRPHKTVIVIELFVFALLFLILQFKSRNYRLMAWLFTVCCGGMFCYLCLIGRLPFRSFQVIFIPLMTVLFYYLSKSNLKIISYNLKVVIVLITTVILSLQFKQVYLHSTEKQSQEKAELEKYCMEHLDNLYIYDITLALNGSPFIVYGEKKPYNVIFWGGSSIYSPIYYEQLKANRRWRLSSKDFLDENIFFLSKNSSVNYLLDYLKKKEGAKGVKIVGNVNDIYIYHFY